MGRYILGRAIQGGLVLLGVSAIVFFSLFLTGDPAAVMMPPDATFAQIQSFRHAMGFDQPIWLQYLRFLHHVLTGRLGESLRYQQPALQLLLQRIPATALLAFTALAWSSLLGFGLGVLAALRQRSLADLTIRIASLLGQAVPVFWLGLLLIIVFSLHLHLLPSSGMGTPAQLLMPSLSLGAYYFAAITRLVRASLVETLGQDYIRTARAKGLSEWRVVAHHALRNALIPVITVQGMYFASLMGGALITETIFAWPGIGRLAVESIEDRDFTVVQATVLFSATMFVLINFLVDLAYLRLNPRVRI